MLHPNKSKFCMKSFNLISKFWKKVKKIGKITKFVLFGPPVHFLISKCPRRLRGLKLITKSRCWALESKLLSIVLAVNPPNFRRRIAYTRFGKNVLIRESEYFRVVGIFGFGFPCRVRSCSDEFFLKTSCF